jgi:hypothetical protein
MEHNVSLKYKKLFSRTFFLLILNIICQGQIFFSIILVAIFAFNEYSG